MEQELQPEVRDNPESSRFEVLSAGGRAIGYTEYELERDRMVITHTVVARRFEGRGVGSRLAKAALDDARRRGLRVTPVCPFTRSYLRRHAEYDDIVDWPDRLSESDDSEDPDRSDD